MGLDIRIPIGAMFALLGLILSGVGLFDSNVDYAKSLGININIWWGLVMLVFGVTMFIFGRRAPQ